MIETERSYSRVKTKQRMTKTEIIYSIAKGIIYIYNILLHLHSI